MIGGRNQGGEGERERGEERRQTGYSQLVKKSLALKSQNTLIPLTRMKMMIQNIPQIAR